MGKKKKFKKWMRESMAQNAYGSAYAQNTANAQQDYGYGTANGNGQAPGATPNWGLGNLPGGLTGSGTQQFLIGAVVGGAVAYVMSDKELREKIIKSAMQLYGSAMGGFEELKEQMADMKAEMEAGRQDGQAG